MDERENTEEGRGGGRGEVGRGERGNLSPPPPTFFRSRHNNNNDNNNNIHFYTVSLVVSLVFVWPTGWMNLSL